MNRGIWQATVLGVKSLDMTEQLMHTQQGKTTYTHCFLIMKVAKEGNQIG